jgi:hypothetical protein
MRLCFPIVLSAIVLSAAGCASAPPAPPAAPAVTALTTPAPVDPVGIFDFTTALEGTVVNGTVTIAKAATGFTGTITTTATEPVPVRTVTVEGQKLTVTADTPDGPVTFVMEFKGDEFTGSWSYAGMAGTHTGKRRTA